MIFSLKITRISEIDKVWIRYSFKHILQSITQSVNKSRTYYFYNQITKNSNALLMQESHVVEVIMALLQHIISHSLIKYKMIYDVRVLMHVKESNLMIFDGNTDYDSEVLKENESVPSMHVVTEFELVF